MNSGHRNHSVYTGIDVWGRNTFGGGGFDSYKALGVIKQANTSCALFAPAWTYEKILDGFKLAEFVKRERHLWLNNDYSGDSIATFISERPIPCSPVFYTNFCLGFGKKYVLPDGTTLDKRWSNLSLQFPTLTFKGKYQTSGQSHIKATFDFKDVYHGSQALSIQITKSDSAIESSYVPLFKIQIDSPGKRRWRIIYQTMNVSIGLVLRGEKETYILTPSPTSFSIISNYSQIIGRQQFKNSWMILDFDWECSVGLLEIGLATSFETSGSILVGEISSYPSSLISETHAVQDLAVGDLFIEGTTKWITISWTHPDNSMLFVVYIGDNIAGVTLKNRYRVECPCETVPITIRTIDCFGNIEALDSATCIIIDEL
jgi:hypothetical protein